MENKKFEICFPPEAKNCVKFNGKRGQMKMSFSMIFSIILIIVFIAFAIFAIYKFLGMQKSVQVLDFKENLQEDVDKLWKGSKGSQVGEYILPEGIERVCFVDFESEPSNQLRNVFRELQGVYSGYENMVFYPIGSASGLDSTKINHINIEEITQGLNPSNPRCFKVDNGKVKMTMQKNFGDALVLIRE